MNQSQQRESWNSVWNNSDSTEEETEKLFESFEWFYRKSFYL